MIARLPVLAAWTALVLVGAGCGSSTGAAMGAGLGNLIGNEATTPVPSPTTTVAPSTTSIAPTTTTTVARDPYTTVVATVRPEVSVPKIYSEPGGDPVQFADPLTNPTYFGNELVLMVTDEGDHDGWLRVRLPVRPNGTEGWIRARDVTLTTHRFRARIDVTARTVTVWEGDDVVADTGAVIGKDRSPTPLGNFYVNELVPKWDSSAYGPYILSLSAFSEVLDSFNGGVPVIAIHGTNRPELIGGAHSNGCIRIANDVITLLAETVPMGTPVEIVA